VQAVAEAHLPRGAIERIMLIRGRRSEEIIHARPDCIAIAFVYLEAECVAQHRCHGEAEDLIAPAVTATEHFIAQRFSLACSDRVGTDRQQGGRVLVLTALDTAANPVAWLRLHTDGGALQAFDRRFQIHVASARQGAGLVFEQAQALPVGTVQVFPTDASRAIGGRVRKAALEGCRWRAIWQNPHGQIDFDLWEFQRGSVVICEAQQQRTLIVC